MRRWAAALGGIAAAALLVGCSSDGADEQSGAPETGGLVEDAGAAGGAPEECLSAYPFAGAEPDLADVEARPEDWPEAPDGSTLCLTAEGGTVETASYVTDAPIEEVFTYYEDQLADTYGLQRVSGADNGTGYASLDGSGENLGFQIRESDGGFVIAFTSGGVQ